MVYVCENGIVIRRRPASLLERIDMLWNGDYYYTFIPYAQIIGFTANWEEIHMVTDSGGILIVMVDLQFVQYKQKLKLLSVIDERSHRMV